MNEHEIRRVAAEAMVDPRTVVSALEGRARSAVTRKVVADALRANGFEREAAKVEKSNRKKVRT